MTRPPSPEVSWPRGQDLHARRPPPPGGRSALIALAVLLSLSVGSGCGAAARRQREGQGHLRLGQAYLQSGNLPGAITELRQAVELDPKNADSHHAIALAYFARELPADAEAHFQQAIELKEDFPEAHLNYGSLLLSQERWDEAVLHLQTAADDPTYRSPVRAHHNLGWAFANLGEHERALDYYRRALRVAPAFCPSIDAMGQVHESVGDLGAALDVYKNAVQCAPNDLGYHLRLGIVAFRLEELDLAGQHLRYVERNDSEYGDLKTRAREYLRYLPAGG